MRATRIEILGDNEIYGKKYWSGVNLLKGLLIILVFIGHIIPGDSSESFTRYIIYSFHMPVFIGISGFLFRTDNCDIKIGKLLVKYWKRLILPWIIAVVVFYVFRNYNKLSVETLLQDFYYPYYHLWYIIGALGYIFVSLLLFKVFRKNGEFCWIGIITVSTIISLCSKFVIFNYVPMYGIMEKILECVRHSLRLYNLIFFVMGAYIRHLYERKKITYNKNNRVIFIYTLIMFLIMCLSYYVNILELDLIRNIVFYIFNGLLLYSIIVFVIFKVLPRNKCIEFIGIYSLPIYLYHVLCQALAYQISEMGSIKYYLICVSTFVLGCAMVCLLKRVKSINRYIFGSVN